MLNRRFRWLLFLSSYVPLFALMAVRAYGHSCSIFWTSAALAVVGIVVVAAFFLAAKGKAPLEVRLLAVERRDSDVAGYVVAYLLPFLTSFDGSWQDEISLVVFIALVGVIYVNSGLVSVNPMFALLGWQLYMVEVTTAPERAATAPPSATPQFLLTREPLLRPGNTLTVREAMTDFLVATPSDD